MMLQAALKLLKTAGKCILACKQDDHKMQLQAALKPAEDCSLIYTYLQHT